MILSIITNEKTRYIRRITDKFLRKYTFTHSLINKRLTIGNPAFGHDIKMLERKFSFFHHTRKPNITALLLDQ